MSPPDLPPKELYKPMGQMLQQIIRGNKFRPVTVKDVATAVAKNAPKVLLLFATSVLGGKPHHGLHACWQG